MHTSTLVIPFMLSSACGQLNDLAKAAGLKYFGSAMSFDGISEPAYVQIASNIQDFGQVTPDNPQKWNPVELEEGNFEFSQADNVTAFAGTNGQMMRCHNLVWGIYLPDWVTQGQWTKDTLTAVLRTHITNEVTHFKGKCYAWDVVNEAVADDGTGDIKESVWTDFIGDDYIQIAFEAAAAADPSAKLYYNDYSISSPGPKRDGVVKLVKSLQAAGIKIDGVGLQSHFSVGQTPSKEIQIESMEAFTALGIEVAITELDVLANLPMTTAESQQQMQDYETTAAACVAVKDCVGITVWGFDDKDSWLTIPGSATGEACLFDANLNRKPAYYGVVAGLTGSAATDPVAQGTKASSSPQRLLPTLSPAANSIPQKQQPTAFQAANFSSQKQVPTETTTSSNNLISSPNPSSSNTDLAVSPFISNTAPTTFSTKVSPTTRKTKGHQHHNHASKGPSSTAVAAANNYTVAAGKNKSQDVDGDADTPCPTAAATANNLTVTISGSQVQNLDGDADTPCPTAAAPADNLATPTGRSQSQTLDDYVDTPYPVADTTAHDLAVSTGKSQSQTLKDGADTPCPTADATANYLIVSTGKSQSQTLEDDADTPCPTAAATADNLATPIGKSQSQTLDGNADTPCSTADATANYLILSTGKSQSQTLEDDADTPCPTAAPPADNLATPTGKIQSQTLDDNADTPCPTADATTLDLAVSTGKSQSQNIEDDADTPCPTAAATAADLAAPTGKSRHQRPNYALEGFSSIASNFSSATGKSRPQSLSHPQSSSSIADDIVLDIVAALGKIQS